MSVIISVDKQDVPQCRGLIKTKCVPRDHLETPGSQHSQHCLQLAAFLLHRFAAFAILPKSHGKKNRSQAIGSPKSHLCALLLRFWVFFQSTFQLYNLSMQGHPNRKGKKSWIFSLALSYFLTRSCLTGLNIGKNTFPDQNGVSYKR